MHTAIETSGLVKSEILEETAGLLDVISMDLKHVDAEKHKLFTGVSNEQILKNWRIVGNMQKQVICRVCVMPGFNDTQGEIEKISDFAAEAGAESFICCLITGMDWENMKHWGENTNLVNTDGHLRSVFIGRNETIVLADGELDLGEFGHLYFIDFDQTRARERTIQVQVMGE